MKYKVGDKFLQEIEVARIVKGDPCHYKMLPDGGEWSEDALDDLRRPDDMTAEEVWEIAKKLIKMSINDRVKIFGNSEAYGVINDYDFPEIKAKIEAWEVGEMFDVGDVIRSVGKPEIKVMVTKCYRSNGTHYDGINSAGAVYSGIKERHWRKTGRHIDIQSVLEQIGGAE